MFVCGTSVPDCFLFFSSSAIMRVRIRPKVEAAAADVQRMLFTTSEPHQVHVQPRHHEIFKDLPRLPFVLQDEMVDFSIYVKKTSHL